MFSWRVIERNTSQGATEMNVLRRVVGEDALGFFSEHATVDAEHGTRHYSYVDTSVQSGKTYAYRIKSVNGAGSSKKTPREEVAIPKPGPTKRRTTHRGALALMSR